MRRLFSLLPLLLPLPNLVQAADPVCTLENRVCAENNNSGKCIRYENTFTCVTVNPAGSRCTVDANPTLTDCTLSAPVCSAESGGICLETTTDFVCKSEPSGEGIRIDDTSVTVSYSKETKAKSLPAASSGPKSASTTTRATLRSRTGRDTSSPPIPSAG